MVLLQEDQLLLQGLNLTLKVHAVQVGVINDLPQANNICLHRLANGQLRLIPVEWTQDGESLIMFRHPEEVAAVLYQWNWARLTSL